MTKKVKLGELRCIHRHTMWEHPSCFYKGLIKYEFKDDREWERVTGIPWYQYPDYRMGYFDIETDNLFADFGTVLSWCFKLKGGDVKSSVITKKEIFDGVYDRRVVQEFVNELKKYKIVIGYNSTNFDLPYMRAKALHYGIEFPSYGDNYHWDLYYTVKSKLRLSRKSLDNACDFLNIKGKTPIERDVWRKAKYGDEKALKTVLEHNVGDVNILEELHDKIGFTRKWIRRSI